MDTVHVTEIWRPIEGWPYEVSSLGRVRRAAPGPGTWVGRILNPRTDVYGYLRVGLCRPGEMKDFLIGPTVCAVFNGPKPSPDLQLRHLDGNKRNNVPANLKWGTVLENCADRALHACGPRQLSDAEVAAFRAEYDEMRREHGRVPWGWLKAFAARYGMSKSSAWNLANMLYRPSSGGT